MLRCGKSHRTIIVRKQSLDYCLIAQMRTSMLRSNCTAYVAGNGFRHRWLAVFHTLGQSQGAPLGQEVVSSHCTGSGVGGAGGSGGEGGDGGGLGLDFTGKLPCIATPHWPAGESSRPRTSLNKLSSHSELKGDLTKAAR